MNPGIEAVRKLAHMGYRPHLEGESIRLRYEGQDAPDPAAVSPLLDLVRQHKDAVLYFLRSFCPQCGGVFFGTFNGVPLCMACYWGELEEFNPSLRVRH